MIIGFDWDGTLVESFTATPLPGVRERLHALPPGTQTFVATNQAGPVYRAMLGDAKYPTVEDVARRLLDGFEALGWRPELLLVAVHPGKEGDDWRAAAVDVVAQLYALLHPVIFNTFVSAMESDRKPGCGMLLDAAKHFGVAPSALTLVGDMASDEQAAKAAGARFQWAAEWRGAI